jgi:hypothetical protein
MAKEGSAQDVQFPLFMSQPLQIYGTRTQRPFRMKYRPSQDLQLFDESYYLQLGSLGLGFGVI